jgi:phage replication O-like protein O
MACPQQENGHLDLANELVEAIAKIHLTGNEFQLLFAVWRKTYCWKKKLDWISLSQLKKITGLNIVAVCRAKKSLIAKNILFEDREKIGFNKNYDEWSLPKTTVLSKTAIGIAENGKRSLPKTTDTKETNTKETNTKETPLILKDNSMKNKAHFLDERRAEKGLPPMERKRTEAQSDFFNRSSLIPIFQKAVNEVHGKSYFTNPHDIEDLKKENSKINGAIKLFWIRCDKDLNTATEVIKWYAGDYGKWKDWTPMYCFRRDTIIDFENKSAKKGGVGEL